jgi:tetratricopeptide (TPR) repeat protein
LKDSFEMAGGGRLISASEERNHRHTRQRPVVFFQNRHKATGGAALVPTGRGGNGGGRTENVAESSTWGLAGVEEPATCQGYQAAGTAYDGFKQVTMKARLGFITILVVALSVSALADRREDAKAQVAFGVQIALKGLWKDATTRFENATALDPTYPSAWNNLGIGYEQLGRPEDAKKAYERALELDPKDQYIRDNYQEFRLIYDRQKKSRGGK